MNIRERQIHAQAKSKLLIYQYDEARNVMNMDKSRHERLGRPGLETRLLYAEQATTRSNWSPLHMGTTGITPIQRTPSTEERHAIRHEGVQRVAMGLSRTTSSNSTKNPGIRHNLARPNLSYRRHKQSILLHPKTKEPYNCKVEKTTRQRSTSARWTSWRTSTDRSSKAINLADQD